MNRIRFLPCGESAVTVEFSRQISEKVNARIRHLDSMIRKASICGIGETVQAFSSLTVNYDPLLLSFETLCQIILRFTDEYQEFSVQKKRVFLIPVCYEDEFAPDLADVCALTGLTSQEVIRIHSGRDYLIYMLGFLPGFPYLGGMDPRIEAPRLDSPRTAIPAGAVGIGGKQTGIYPLESPGGWRLIGRTPVKVYDPERKEPILYRAGDYIRFVPISAEEFVRLERERAQMEVQEEEI